MNDFCGIIGAYNSGFASLKEAIPDSDRQTSEYRGENVAVYQSVQPQRHENQPATAADGSLIWIFGTVYGFDGEVGYESRTDFSVPNAEYCADLFDRCGIDFVHGLNGEFSGLVLDQQSREAHLFTDRIGSKPLFYTQTETALFFSSRIQAIGLHPGINSAFDRRYLAEFFALQKALGTATPLVDLHKVPPASILSTRLDGSLRDQQTYWQPRYRPRDRPPEVIGQDIVQSFKEVIEDRVWEELDYGVLLSGGSDSRLLLGVMKDLGMNPTAFHISSWMSKEARTAERVAMEVGAPFRLLRREADYHEHLLKKVPPVSNFIGAFDEYMASGFTEQLGSVDVVLTGYLGDTMFGEYPLHIKMQKTRLKHPLFYPRHKRESTPKSVSEFISQYLDRYPDAPLDFLDAPNVVEVMRQNISVESESIHHHGVGYPSFRSLQLCDYYPLTNQFAFANTDSVRQITGHWSPFFDRRLIDVSLSIPIRDRIDHNLINRALAQLSPDLAKIPHPGTDKKPINNAVHEISNQYLNFPEYAKSKYESMSTFSQDAGKENFLDEVPKPYLDHGPWIDENELIRNHNFVGEAIERNRDVIDSLPFLDGDAVRECYQNHLDGDNDWQSLYTLVTLLETPVARRIAGK